MILAKIEKLRGDNKSGSWMDFDRN